MDALQLFAATLQHSWKIYNYYIEQHENNKMQVEKSVQQLKELHLKKKQNEETFLSIQENFNTQGSRLKEVCQKHNNDRYGTGSAGSTLVESIGSIGSSLEEFAGLSGSDRSIIVSFVASLTQGWYPDYGILLGLSFLVEPGNEGLRTCIKSFAELTDSMKEYEIKIREIDNYVEKLESENNVMELQIAENRRRVQQLNAEYSEVCRRNAPNINFETNDYNNRHSLFYMDTNNYNNHHYNNNHEKTNSVSFLNMDPLAPHENNNPPNLNSFGYTDTNDENNHYYHNNIEKTNHPSLPDMDHLSMCNDPFSI